MSLGLFLRNGHFFPVLFSSVIIFFIRLLVGWLVAVLVTFLLL